MSPLFHGKLCFGLLTLACTTAMLPAQEKAPEWNTKPAVIIPTAGRAPWIGFEVARADEVVRAQLPKLPKGVGFVISNVIANGPARQAGIMPFDVLWKWNEQFLINEAQLAVILQMHKPGDAIELTLFRAGEEKKLTVTLAAEPDPRAVAAGPTIESTKTPTIVPMLDITRPLDVNTRIARLEDGNAVLEMESRTDGNWLTITDANGNTIFEGLYDITQAKKSIPTQWHDRINALHRTLEDRITRKSPDATPDITPVTPVSNPRE